MGQATKQRPALISLVRETIAEFLRHKSPWLAAAIAYFTIFAVAPLIIVIVEIAGLFLGRHQDVLDELYGYMSSTAGPAAAKGIEAIVTATVSQRRTGSLAQIISWGIFIFAAVGLFSSMQDALNTIWDVGPTHRSLIETIKDRLISFGAVLTIAFLLLVSLGINALLTVAAAALTHVFPAFPSLLKAAEFVVSLGLITLLFAFLFEYLPERHIAWRDVWLGASVSATLFVLGEFLLGWYLGRAGVSSGYGSFGGLIIFLLWVYYSAQIVLFGAEFTHVFANRNVKPSLGVED